MADEYLKEKNISSVGIGYKEKEGKQTDELALQFTVGKKAAPEEPEAISSHPIPESITVNGMTFPTDVVERDFKTHPVAVATEAKPDRKQRLDPMKTRPTGFEPVTFGFVGCGTGAC